MLRVYGTFARDGSVPTYRMIRRIETKEGKVLYEAPAVPEAVRVISNSTAQSMTYMLQQVAKRGTGAALASRYGVESGVAGKTGTTQDQADGWFMGYTSDLVMGAWVGGAYPTIRWRSLSQGQGAKTALPIVGKFLRSYEKARGVTQFAELPESERFRYECSDRRWAEYYFEEWMNGEPYEPGVGYDEDGNPIYIESSEEAAHRRPPPADDRRPRAPHRRTSPRPTFARRTTRRRIREREASNARLERAAEGRESRPREAGAEGVG